MLILDADGTYYTPDRLFHVVWLAPWYDIYDSDGEYVTRADTLDEAERLIEGKN